jgi:carboxymethylenebutenolidase
VIHDQATIRTADGECPTHFFAPDGDGPWPTVIVYMDAGGVRQTLFDICRRVTENGYAALLPDLFYRSGEVHIPTPKEMFEKGNIREVVGPLMAKTGPDKAAADTAAYLAWLDERGAAKGKIGTVGFCMGGGMAIAVAGAYPDRIGAAVSFHGGNLATDAPNSPHLSAPAIKGEVYVAGADEDGSYPPEMHERLKAAFDAAGVTYRAEIYEGAHHGWMKPDFPIYDEAAAERGWREMLALFGRTLG